MSSALARHRVPVQEWGMGSKERTHQEEELDEALEESFPASDPIALSASNRHVQDTTGRGAKAAATRAKRRKTRKAGRRS